MATPEEIRKQLPKQFSKFLQKEYSNNLETVTFSKEFYTKVAELLENEISKEQEETTDPDFQETIRILSKDYQSLFSNFFDSYRKWKTYRKELIRTSTKHANKISFISSFVSIVRILTSTANIFSTMELFPQFTSFWKHPAVKSSPAIALGFIYCERIVTTQFHTEADKMTQKDEEMFHDLESWFCNFKRLDEAVNILFPKGIDKDIVKRIERQSILGEDSTVGESTKLFTSIIASNVTNDADLLEDESFLEKAAKFATSSGGIQWFHKTLLENDPAQIEMLKLRMPQNTSDSEAESVDSAAISGFTLLPIPTLKLVLNGVTIFSALSDLWNSECKATKKLRNLVAKANQDLVATKRVVKCLCPPGMDITHELD